MCAAARSAIMGFPKAAAAAAAVMGASGPRDNYRIERAAHLPLIASEP